MGKFIRIPELPHKLVIKVFRKYGYKIPANVDKSVLDKWYRGTYYGYGSKETWLPLNSMGGIAINAFHSMIVKFPKRVDIALNKLLEEKYTAEKIERRKQRSQSDGTEK